LEDHKLTNKHILAFNNYLHGEEKSAATCEKYLRDVRHFMRYAGGSLVTKDLVAAWKHHLICKGYAPRSVNSMLASVNSIFVMLGWENCKVKNLRLQQQTYCEEEKELTKEEYLRLLAAARGDEQLNLILQSICAAGIRVSELQYFTVEALHHGRITIHSKGKIRSIIIPEQLRRMLLGYARRKRIVRGAIFRNSKGRAVDRSTIWRKMKRLCVAADVAPSKVFPHNLRKLFARSFYGIDKDIAKLADILGHSSINTTRIYIMSTGAEHRQKIESLGLTIPTEINRVT